MSFKKHLPISLRAIFIIVVVIAAVLFIVFFIGLQDKTQRASFGYTPSGIPIPEEVHAYTGKVESVEGDTVAIRAEAHNNYLQEETIFVVKLSQKTRIERYELPKNVPSGVRRVNATKQPISIGEIKIGDYVEVYSKKNLRGKTSFGADIVQVLQ